MSVQTVGVNYCFMNQKNGKECVRFAKTMNRTTHKKVMRMIKEYITKHERTENTDSIGYVQPLIRCKYCHYSTFVNMPYGEYYCKNIEKYISADWFCADGERRTE